MPLVQCPNLSLLSPGSAPGEPGGLIASSAMSSLVDKLRQRFEFVVIDSPPILAFSDGRALSAMVDGIIMVGRSGVTTRENLKRAMELLRGAALRSSNRNRPKRSRTPCLQLRLLPQLRHDSLIAQSAARLRGRGVSSTTHKKDPLGNDF